MTRKSVIARDIKRQKTVERFALKRAALKKAFLNPKSITLFLSKFISNGWEISILLTSKDFALTASVEKKTIIKARVEKKIYKRLI